MLNYEVQQGDCISSIGRQHGFTPDTLWNHPRNATLKTLRKDPNILLAGDTVFIPDLQQKQVGGSTDARHCFKLKNWTAKFRLRLLKGNAPRANVSYVLNIDGTVTPGQTDGDGWLEAPIAPDAKQGKLTLSKTGEEYPLQLGHLDPIDQASGVQTRLHSLGYFGGEITGEIDDATTAAISAFQKDKNLTSSGISDSQTQDALKAAYGS